MGSASGSHESVKRGQKRPYCRFATPKTCDLDPSSYLPNSFRRGILGSSYTGSCIARSRRARIAAVDPLALDRGHAPCNAYGWIFEIPHSPVLVLAQIPGILPFAYGVGWARGAGYTWGERTSEKRSIFNGFSRPHFCLSPTYLCVSRHLPHRSTDGSYCARDYPVGAPIPERVGPGRG